MRSRDLRRADFRRRRAIVVAFCLAVAAVAGCEEPTVPFTETKDVDERLTEQDLTAVVAVATAVGEKARFHLPKPLLPAPQWTPQRSLPVGDLTREEISASEAAWSPTRAEARLPKEPPWDAAIAAQGLTREQFCALVISVAAALAKANADSDLDLQGLERLGEREIESLTGDDRPYSSLSAEEQNSTLRRAAWIAIAGRAGMLSRVPTDNVRLVTEHREALAEVLPPEFFADPFAGLYPRPEDYGIPFEEGELSDLDLTWNPKNALIGTDRPDDSADGP